jgi:TnpA family transposase
MANEPNSLSAVVTALRRRERKMQSCTYAPRIKNLKKQSLYMFRSQRGADRTGWTIKPDKYVDRDLITASWDDVLRLVAIIKLKESTA